MASRLSTLLLHGSVVLAIGGCAHGDPRMYALRAPVVRDQDLDLVTIRCTPGEPCGPQPYESSFAWDAVDNTLYRPVSEALRRKPQGPAQNVNAFDEVPDSAWFTNRIGVRAFTAREVADGYCPAGKTLGDGPDGSWLIDHGKDNGANPGFRVRSDGTKYMIKLDDSQPERATGATSVATRFYYAAGWWAPCDSVVYFRRSLLRLKPGLEIKANVGPPRKFDEDALDEMLRHAASSMRGGRYRAAASRWVPGKALGPFTYEGTRSDDPSDTIPHEHRRDLRGARVMAAWLNHFDSREQNSMETWLSDEDLAAEQRAFAHAAAGDAASTKGGSPAQMHGHVRRWYIDLGDCFGSEWTVDGFSRRHGFAYLLDWQYLAEDFVTLGSIERPWERHERDPAAPLFGYFGAADFVVDRWRGEYPNPAFENLDEGDGAWATRIIARFTKEQIEAAVDVGDWTNPRHRDHLVEVLLARRKAILGRYFARLSPVTDVTADGDRICATDLARKTATWPEGAFHYRGSVKRGAKDRFEPLAVTALEGGRVCVPLASEAPRGGPPDDAAERYVVVRITNGIAPGPLELHFYDLGPDRGLGLVGIARPES